MKKVRGYIFSREFNSSVIPQHVQNIIIRDFCNNNNLQYLLSATEYSMRNSYSVLDSVLKELKKLNGVVFYSLYLLPECKKDRLKIYNKFRRLSKTLYFAVENLIIKSNKDFIELEELIIFKELSREVNLNFEVQFLKNFLNANK